MVVKDLRPRLSLLWNIHPSIVESVAYICACMYNRSPSKEFRKFKINPHMDMKFLSFKIIEAACSHQLIFKNITVWKNHLMPKTDVKIHAVCTLQTCKVSLALLHPGIVLSVPQSALACSTDWTSLSKLSCCCTALVDPPKNIGKYKSGWKKTEVQLILCDYYQSIHMRVI